MSSKFFRGAATSALVAACALAQAPNDQPVGATLLVGPGAYADDNSTSVVDGPLAACGAPSDDLWYYYIPTTTGVATLTTCAASGGGAGNAAGVPGNDTVIGVWADGGGAPGAAIGCDDDTCSLGFESVLSVAITSGVGLYVSVSGWGGTPSGGAYVLEVTEAGGGGGPANDAPGGATLVFGPSATVADDNTLSALEGPLGNCGGMNKDLWYYYVPTQNGIVTITTCNANGGLTGNVAGIGDSVLAAWVDAGGLPGTQIVCNDDSCSTTGLASTISVSITAGIGFYVSAGGFNGSIGTFALDFLELGGPTPTGDDCTVADATAVGPGVYAYNSAGFFIPGPASGCSTGADANDYWFAYTATSTGLAIVSNCPGSTAAPGGSAAGNTDTAISAWDATSCPPTTELACSDGAPQCGVAQSEVSFPVVSGTTYYIQVQGWAPGAAISGAIAIVETLPPVNDDCAGALPITANVPVVASNGTATTSVPTSSCGIPTGDLWYSFTSPCSGSIVIETCGSGGFDTVVSAWDNCGGIELACNDDATTGDCAGTLMSYIELTGVAQGQTIYISVSGWNGGTGTFTLNVHCKYTHLWTSPAGPGSIQLENVDGPANALAFSAVTLDLLHPGLPANQTFPNGWFFGVPMGFPELFQQITWPGGLPFTGILNANGYVFNFVLPAGTTSGLAGIATIWSVGVAFDPLTGFATVSDATDPTAFPL